MRYLSKRSWPYKVKVIDFNDNEHDDFLRSHPEVKMMILERRGDYKKSYHYDVYFQKESDLILYKLCI